MQLSAEQDFWLLLSNPKSKQLDVTQTPVEIEVPKELLKVSLVKTGFQKLKNHLASFDKVVKVRTTPDAIIEVHGVLNTPKRCDGYCNADFVPINVLSVNNKCLMNDNLEIERLEQENDHLFKLLLSQDIVHICVNSIASLNDRREMQQGFIHEYNENLMLKVELDKKEHMVEKKIFDEVVLRCTRLENRSANLELKLRHQKESKNMVEKDVQPNNPNVIAPGMFKLDLEPLAPKVLKNKDAHIDYIKHSQEQSTKTLDSDLDSACKIVQRIQEVLVYVKDTCPSLTKPSEKLVAVTPLNKNKKVRFAEAATSSRWKPTRRTFTINVNTYPLTRITSTKVVPFKETTSKSVSTQNPEVKVYSRRPKVTKYVGSSSKSMIVESRISNNSEPNQSWGSNASDVPFSSLVDFRFENNQIVKIIGYGDYQMGKVMISRVYYMEGLGHNLFFVGQFCDSDLVLQRQSLGYGIEGKSKKHSHKPKAKDIIQEKLNMLHMDLCGPMRIQSINGRKYILVIVDDYSRFTWSKISIKDNGTKFVNQTLRAYYEDVTISLQTLVARTPQQNGVVKRRNRTLVEAACTMLIFSKAPLFFWAEAVATTCFTQNRSLIRKRHNKTPYELLHHKKTDLSYLHVFGALCYPINDSEDLGKLKPKADIGIFVAYAPAKKVFRIYNKRTRRITETIHVDFDELIAMASEQFSSGLGPQLLTPRTICSGLVPNPPSPTPVASPVPVIVTPKPIDSTGTPSLTHIDKDAPSPSTSQAPQESQSLVISSSFEEHSHDIEVSYLDNDPFFGVPIPELNSE
ncbi:retrovirus-related pol polyprotein from transposon TNT 1-94 [Tanacetum coccineum]